MPKKSELRHEGINKEAKVYVEFLVVTATKEAARMAIKQIKHSLK